MYCYMIHALLVYLNTAHSIRYMNHNEAVFCRVLYGYPSVLGAFFLMEDPTVRFGAVLRKNGNLTVRFGAVLIL